jgi:hypothetical protein
MVKIRILSIAKIGVQYFFEKRRRTVCFLRPIFR